MVTSAPGVLIPRAEDGWPLVDMQIVGEALERYPGLRMSFEEFLTLDGVWGDWIDGRVGLRGCQGLAHHDALNFVAIAFRWYLDQGDPRAGNTLRQFLMRSRPDLPARTADLLYLTRDHADRVKDVFVDGPADIVVEVVDDESRHRDMIEKFREFEAGGVREYWLIDPAHRQASVYRLRNGRYEPMPAGDPPALRSEVLDGLWIDPEWIWNDRDTFEVLREWGFDIPPRRRR